jgi:hypothetical protein
VTEEKEVVEPKVDKEAQNVEPKVDKKANGGVPDVKQTWPQVSPNDREVYGFIDPAWGAPMVAMTQFTWQNIIADTKKLQERLRILSEENIRMKQGQKLEADQPQIITLNPRGH